MSTSTPWGASQQRLKLGTGINMYSTASHGGIKVSEKLNRSIPAQFREESGWYEEDCRAAIPLYFLADHVVNEDMKKYCSIESCASGISYSRAALLSIAENDEFKSRYPEVAAVVPRDMIGRQTEEAVSAESRLVQFLDLKSRMEDFSGDQFITMEPIHFNSWVSENHFRRSPVHTSHKFEMANHKFSVKESSLKGVEMIQTTIDRVPDIVSFLTPDSERGPGM